MTATDLRPIALTCGEPAGIGAEIAVLARLALPDLPFLWLGDPRHLARGTAYAEIATPTKRPLCQQACCPYFRTALRARLWQATQIRPMPKA